MECSRWWCSFIDLLFVIDRLGVGSRRSELRVQVEWTNQALGTQEMKAQFCLIYSWISIFVSRLWPLPGETSGLLLTVAVKQASDILISTQMPSLGCFWINVMLVFETANKPLRHHGYRSHRRILSSCWGIIFTVWKHKNKYIISDMHCTFSLV